MTDPESTHYATYVFKCAFFPQIHQHSITRHFKSVNVLRVKGQQASFQKSSQQIKIAPSVFDSSKGTGSVQSHVILKGQTETGILLSNHLFPNTINTFNSL